MTKLTRRTSVHMAVDEINAAGGIDGRTVSGTISASDWPLCTRIGKQMLEREEVAALFGCWISASRKSVLPARRPLSDA